MLPSTFEGSPRVRPLPMNTSQLPGGVSGVSGPSSGLGLPGGNGVPASVVTGSTGQLPVGTAVGVMKNGAALQGEEEVCVLRVHLRGGYCGGGGIFLVVLRVLVLVG